MITAKTVKRNLENFLVFFDILRAVIARRMAAAIDPEQIHDRSMTARHDQSYEKTRDQSRGRCTNNSVVFLVRECCRR